jgi:hypothetical protein
LGVADEIEDDPLEACAMDEDSGAPIGGVACKGDGRDGGWVCGAIGLGRSNGEGGGNGGGGELAGTGDPDGVLDEVGEDMLSFR